MSLVTSRRYHTYCRTNTMALSIDPYMHTLTQFIVHFNQHMVQYLTDSVSRSLPIYYIKYYLILGIIAQNFHAVLLNMATWQNWCTYIY
ncbi:hypothetical protein BMR1_02g02326 [Babesia microti strain RI]|uniref:Uncharacterized protein n=1 Tax=Babesia microti (strain RI) TaxID=1133968 RepID=A0A1R4AAF6_BABMR|nr:hypothetical protein BMR1_02g02326 [Babesia microti strain RI]SJK85986.1 hypothetical protein BMR1_02g02326 [Babesia microti strain RI]|eukprot:XP_021338186.1 hypothetical protein BMR1_02g02326 [Babesia microti strain RI]